MSSVRRPGSSKILLVEDDEDLRKMLAYALRKQGFEVLVTPNGLPALPLWRVAQPDVVLLDVESHHSSGMGVLDRIGRDGTTPIIVLTATNDPGLRADCLRRGANDLLLKPFRLGYLIERIQQLSRKERVEDSSAAH